MRVSHFSVDLVSGHIQSPKGSVKTNQFYRDAFVREMRECALVPAPIKRQMGLNSIYSDEKTFKHLLAHHQHHHLSSNAKKSMQPSSTSTPNIRYPTTTNTALPISFTSALPATGQSQLTPYINPSASTTTTTTSKNQRIANRLPFSQEQLLRHPVGNSTSTVVPTRKIHTSQATTKDRIITSESQQQINSSQPQKIQVFESMIVRNTSSDPAAQPLNSHLQTSNKAFENNQFTLPQVATDMQQPNDSQSHKASSANSVNAPTPFGSIPGTTTSIPPAAFQNKTITIHLAASNASTRTSPKFPSQQTAAIQPLGQHEYLTSGVQLSDHIIEQANQENRGEYFPIPSKNYRNQNNPTKSQLLPNHSNNYITSQNNQFPKQSIDNLQQFNAQLEDSSHSKQLLHAIKSGALGSQRVIPVQNRANVADEDDRRELLSIFNENRLKFFSNSDLHAEKYFVTRNRERIKDLNFERIGIFKSKQPQTHVKHFRFFNNDIKVSEQRFQQGISHERKSLEVRRASQPHSLLENSHSKLEIHKNNNYNKIVSQNHSQSSLNSTTPIPFKKPRVIKFEDEIEDSLQQQQQQEQQHHHENQLELENEMVRNLMGLTGEGDDLNEPDLLMKAMQKTGESMQMIEKSQCDSLNSSNNHIAVEALTGTGENQFDQIDEQAAHLTAIEDMFFLKLDEKERAKYESEEFHIERKKVLLDTVLKNKKIQVKDKKLIYSNLIYQYSKEANLHSEQWCTAMTDFLLGNKFKYDLDEAANRKYQRAYNRTITLPIFRKTGKETKTLNARMYNAAEFYEKRQSANYTHFKLLRDKQ